MFDVWYFCYLHPVLSLITLHNMSSTCGAPDKINIYVYMTGKMIKMYILFNKNFHNYIIYKVSRPTICVCNSQQLFKFTIIY